MKLARIDVERWREIVRMDAHPDQSNIKIDGHTLAAFIDAADTLHEVELLGAGRRYDEVDWVTAYNLVHMALGAFTFADGPRERTG